VRQLGAIVWVAALVVLAGCGSGSGSDSQTAFSYRAHATTPTPPFQRVLQANGLNLQANCMRASGAPVFNAGASTTVPGASLVIHYGLQDGETPTSVYRNLRALTAENGVARVLGPIGRHDSAAGTMTFLRPDGGSVTVTFLEITGAPDTDCVFGGSALVHSGS
jgi:hypothetical protein